MAAAAHGCASRAVRQGSARDRWRRPQARATRRFRPVGSGRHVDHRVVSALQRHERASGKRSAYDTTVPAPTTVTGSDASSVRTAACHSSSFVATVTRPPRSRTILRSRLARSSGTPGAGRPRHDSRIARFERRAQHALGQRQSREPRRRCHRDVVVLREIEDRRMVVRALVDAVAGASAVISVRRARG